MRHISSIAEMKTFSRQVHSGGKSLALVPTMGALHEGHVSLMRQAQRQCDAVVISIFVNPLQFGPGEDLTSYPRNLEADLELLRPFNLEAVFTPSAEEMYPPGFQSFVVPGETAEAFEGAARPGHFRGVLTAVLKLFSIVRPEVAYFGQKDFQQAVLVRQLVRDLALPIRIVVMPTVRESDGLAISSRNAYLDPAQRRLAPIVRQAVTEAARAFTAGETEPAELENLANARLAGVPGLTIDYVAVVEETTLSRPQRAVPGSVLVVAVKLGTTRLIDNVVLGAERL